MKTSRKSRLLGSTMLSLDMLPTVASEETWYGAVDAGIVSMYMEGFEFHERVIIGEDHDQFRREHGEILVSRFETRQMAPVQRGGLAGRRRSYL